MERNWDMILCALDTAYEAKGTVPITPEKVEERFGPHSMRLFNYNVRLLVEHGLLKGSSGLGGACCIEQLTWEGHAFRENLLNPTILKVAQKVSDVAFPTVIQAVLTAGIEFVRKTAGF